MEPLILIDARAAPDLFLWNGAIGRDHIKEWLSRNGWVIPDDLVMFWTISGGGEVFETEIFLRPSITSIGEDEIRLLTEWCLERGLPGGHIVFHEGFCYSAIRSRDGAYITLDAEMGVCGEYDNLDQWYTQSIRAEYATKYRLPPIAFR